MIYVKQLTRAEIITLEEMHDNHPLHLTRNRAHAILLSFKGNSVPIICGIYNVFRQTVSTWFSNWEEQGLNGLVDLPGRGRPSSLTEEEKSKVIKLIEKSPRSLNKVLADVKNEMGITISMNILKSICENAGFVWKRVRASLRSKRNQVDFEIAEEEIKELRQQDTDNIIDLYYFDESGFTLEPCIPYAYQYTGETIEVPSSKSKRLNVLGFINRECNFESFVFEGSVTSSIVVACIDQFSNTIKRSTTLVIDNASTHTSYEFDSYLETWEDKGLHIYRLPAYSPELNIIEIVWRKIKYDWLPFSAYESYESLKNELFSVLSGIGEHYKISFA
jgi:transposase